MLEIEEIAEVEGPEAQMGNTVWIHYVGTFPEGEQFDSSRDRNQPLSFRLGSGQVIQGFDMAVIGMKVGQRRKVTIPSNLGYGAAGAGGVIPPNATLVFDLELMRIG